MSMPIASVVIAAHDEEATIGSTLAELLDEAAPGELEVVVVCNGCRDATAEAARAHEGVVVVELADANKSGALAAGEHHVRAYPRIYLDADVVLSTRGARALALALADEAPAVAGVLADMDLAAATRGVRWFYDFRGRLPVFGHGVIGAGVYAMSATGRERFGPWPDVLGDDLLALRLFPPEERRLVAGHRAIVTGPRDLGEVVRRGIRVRRGNRQLDSLRGDLPLQSRPRAGLAAALREALREPRAWPGAMTFLAVTTVVRVRTRWGSSTGDWPSSAGKGGMREPSRRGYRAA